MFASYNVIREEVHRQAGENIKRAQKKQQNDYESRIKSLTSNYIHIGAEVLLKIEKMVKIYFQVVRACMLFQISPKGLITF